MSAPPQGQSYSAPPPSNPDKRPLPEGWITQFDPNYKAWFYVNTKAQPPVITWDHPANTPAPPPYPPPYAPPSSAPPGNNQNSGNSSGYPGASPSPYAPQPAGSYSQPYSTGPYPQSTPQPYDPYRQGPGGQYNHQPPQGGGYYPQQQYAPYPQQQMVNSGKPKKSGGMGGAGMLAAGAGAGLLGGLLVADAIDDFGDNDYDGGFDDGGW